MATFEKLNGERSVAVVGGGLVGSLQASLLAERGFQVSLYESRGDIRTMTHVSGRSINLALSARGREALKAVGMEAAVLEEAIPMYSRMIHTVSGGLSTQLYGTKGQCIYSVDRRRLNEQLLTLAEGHDNVSLHFNHKLIRADFDKRTLEFSTPDESSVTMTAEFMFGCDGAHSTMRRQMMRWGRLNYEQEYIDHGYKELRLPPLDNGDYALAPYHLHIWPRHEFMMIALPNTDHSFTVTLFMPFTTFDTIQTNDELLTFFNKYFPDSVDKIGVDNLTKEYFSNPTSRLISVKCYPHFMSGCAVLLGDAAHAVVPFYGQGMNAGFEDCLIFHKALLSCQDDIVKAAQCYSDTHWKDCHAIAELSKYNYLEMRSHVNSYWFILLKNVDLLLHWLFPRLFLPLYSMVAFSRIPYHQVVVRSQRQRRLVKFAMVTCGVGVLVCGVCIVMERSGAYSLLRYRIIPCVLKCAIEDFFD